MKHLLKVLVGIVAFIVLLSCATGDEAAGDKAYNMAQRTSGDTRRTQLKTAFMHYRRAVMANPEKVSTKLRNRFIDMCLVRARMVLEEGSASMDAIPLLMEDIESQLKGDVQTDLRQQYAAFLVQLGDSSAVKLKFIDALRYYDRAIEKAADAAPFKEKRRSVIRSVAEENYDIGMMEFEAGQKEKDEGKLVRAEYFAKVALYFDSTFEKAQKLLSDARKANTEVIAAYLRYVDDYTDTVMFRTINNFDILLGVTQLNTSGGVTHFGMHSNTYNPLRMKSEHFALVDADGRKFHAAAGQKMNPDILDFERMGEYNLRFPAVSGQVRKMIYENGPHYTEKYFF
jgi:tetratricopeptide (TPR) repeat protein